MKRTRLRTQSKKAARINRELAKHNDGICKAADLYQTPCSGPTVVHHKIRRSVRPDLVLEPSNLVCLCTRHHGEVHDRPTLALELGLLKNSWDAA